MGDEKSRLTTNPLRLDEVIAEVSSDETGGIVTFTGTVRSQSRGKTIVRLEYEAYEPMAEKKLDEIVRAVEAEVPGARVAVRHRLGTLVVGETAVVIAAAAAHRAEAFTACREVIERLKKDVPIFKKEIADDGEEWVGLGP